MEHFNKFLKVSIHWIVVNIFNIRSLLIMHNFQRGHCQILYFARIPGVPAISVPVGFSRRSLPIGMQLIGRHFGEATLLNAAKYLEQQFQFPQLTSNSRFKQLLS